MPRGILVLQGSPRKKGNTATVCGSVAAGAKAQGARVQTVRLAEKRIGGCIECYACQRDPKGPGRCAVKDDFQAVLAKMRRAEVLVLATPVFCWSPSTQLKALLDRTFCTFRWHADGDYDSVLEGKELALVATAGGPPEDGLDLTAEIVRRWQRFSRLRWRGQLLAPNLTDPKATAVDRRLLARAERLGCKLAGG